MRDQIDSIFNKRNADKMDIKIGIGEVGEIEKIRDRYRLPSQGEGDDILDFYDAIESSEDVSAQGIIELLFDGSWDNFREMVQELNKLMADSVENKVSQLTVLTDVLSRFKRKGVLDYLQDEGIIDKKEKNALSSHKQLEDLAQDIVSLTNTNILQTRVATDLGAVIMRIRKEINNSRSRRAGSRRDTVLDTLESTGLIDHRGNAKYLNEPEDDRMEFGDGRRRRDDRDRLTDRRRQPRDDRSLSRRESEEDNLGSYNRQPRKKLNLNSYDRDRGGDRTNDERDDEHYEDERYDRGESFRDERRRDSRRLDLGRRDRRDDRYDERRDDRDRYDERDRRDSRRDRFDSRLDRRPGSRRDRRDTRGRSGDVVYQFHPDEGGRSLQNGGEERGRQIGNLNDSFSGNGN